MNKSLIILLLVFPIALFGQNLSITAASYTIPNTEIRCLKSNVNQVEYKLYISYPEGYDKDSNQHYDVLYLLDADYSFAIARNIVTHLSERNHLEKLIIVGIGYKDSQDYRINRTRDYTPTHIENSSGYKKIHQEYSGGGKLFKEFLETELIPFIGNNYRVTENRVITGHSYGGLFATWVLMTDPTLFNGYIIVSPSLWYDDHLLFKIPNKLDENNNRLIKIYFMVGDREVNNLWNMPDDLNLFVNRIKDSNLNIKKEVGNNETHNSIFPRALSNGIRFVFDGI